MILVTTLCLVAAVNAVSDAEWYYAEMFAKDYFFPLAAGAYTDNRTMLQSCINRADEKAITGGIFEAHCDIENPWHTCKAYTAVLPEQQAIVIAFRGTDQGIPQLLMEVTESLSGKPKWFVGGSVSRYFHEAFIALWSAALQEQIEDHLAKYPGYKIWVTGHSLGGAIANLAASWIKNKDPERKVKLFTYGAPRVGDKTFRDTLEMQMEEIYRVTHRRDTVTHIPWNSLGYYHAGHEIYYKGEMKLTTDSCEVADDKKNCYVTCEQSEDSKCAYGWHIPSIKDHRTYYGSETISDWGNKGCPPIDTPPNAR